MRLRGRKRDAFRRVSHDNSKYPLAVWVLAMRFAAPSLSALIAILLATPTAPRAVAADPAPPAKLDPAGAEFFENKIRPVLTQHCVGCHSADAEKAKKLKGNLYLDSRDGVLKGGDTGPSLVPGKPADSLLLKTLKYDGDVQMPPKGKLPDAVIADFEKWIAMGAPDPRGDSAILPKRQIGLTIEEGRKFWAYKLPVAPRITEGGAAPIDALVFKKLDAKGLKFAPEADRATLIRRLYYDLTGLPPTPEEVDAFVSDKDRRTLTRSWSTGCSRRRSSASAGAGTGSTSPATPSRSRSAGSSSRKRGATATTSSTPSTRDLPFDRFIREQIAGDLLPADRQHRSRARQLVATTFLALGQHQPRRAGQEATPHGRGRRAARRRSAKGFLGQTIDVRPLPRPQVRPDPDARLLRARRHPSQREVDGARERLEVARSAAARRRRTRSRIAEARRTSRGTAREAQRRRRRKRRSKIASGVLAVKDLPGIVVDDAQAKKVGEWKVSTHNDDLHRRRLRSRQGRGQGREDAHLPAGNRASRASTRCGSPTRPAPTAPTNVPVTVFSADGEKTFTST